MSTLTLEALDVRYGGVEAVRGLSFEVAPGEIVGLTSTSDSFIPPRGRSYMKFSYDFPEPSGSFGESAASLFVFVSERGPPFSGPRLPA